MSSRRPSLLASPLCLLALLGGATAAGAAPITERVSVTPGGAGGDAPSGMGPGEVSLSADGRLVAFSSEASDLVPGDTTGTLDVFVRDRRTGTTARVGPAAGGSGPVLSADGRLVLLRSTTRAPDGGRAVAPVLVVAHLRRGTTTHIPVGRRGARASRLLLVGHALSADGRRVAFATARLEGRGEVREAVDYAVYVHDRATGRTRRVTPFGQDTEAPSLSATGRVLAFETRDALVRADRNTRPDVYVLDLATGRRARVSVSSRGRGADGVSTTPVLSASGRRVAFASTASNLSSRDTNRRSDVFVHDRRTGRTIRASVRPDGRQFARDALAPALAADGRRVAFQLSGPGGLIGNIRGPVGDVHARDLRAGRTALVSVTRAGAASRRSGDPAISRDGRVVAFPSASAELVEGDVNRVSDVFVRGPLAFAGGRGAKGPGLRR